MKHVRFVAPHLVIGAVLVTVLVLGHAAPRAFKDFLREDGWGEWATFLTFLAAGVLAIRSLLRARARSEKLALLGLAAFTLFVAGEEISWGHRLFAFEPPEMFLEHNYQQELNLHNLLKGIFDTRWQVLIIAAAYGVLLPIAVRIRPGLIPRAFAPSLVLVPWFVAVAVLEVDYPFKLTGELAELLLGLAMLHDLAIRSQNGDHAAAAPMAAALLSGVMLVSAFAAPLTDRLIYGSDPDRIALARSELEMLARDLEKPDVAQRKLFRMRSVHKRVFTAVKSGYFRFRTLSEFLESKRTVAESETPDARRDRRGFFLDPWNQPYWVLAFKDDGRTAVLFYSFGPNRRRDGRPRSIAKAETLVRGEADGDDIAALFVGP